MSMPTTDYHQQLLCYLQNWRQLLEQWAAMAAGLPLLTAPPVLPTAPAGGQFMAPFMPAMPLMPPMPFMPPVAPTAPVPPAPADYTQQLFSYLQAWRQYLEQATGASPASQPAPIAQQPTAVPANDSGKTGPRRPPDVLIPPGDPTGGKGVLQSDDHKGSNPKWPPLQDVPPGNYHQTQLTGTSFNPAATPFDRPFDGPGERFQMADPVTLSARPGASRLLSEATAHPEVGSAFLRTMNSVEHAAAPQIASRFKEAGETHSP